MASESQTRLERLSTALPMGRRGCPVRQCGRNCSILYSVCSPSFGISSLGARYMPIQGKYISQHCLQVGVAKGPSSGQWEVSDSLLELSLKNDRHAPFPLHPLKHPASPAAETMAGGPAVKMPCFHCTGPRFDPWSGN